jgi:universal stress protein A
MRGSRAGPEVALCHRMKTSPKRILMATDFSDGGDEALNEAIVWAKQTGVELEIVHVLEVGLEKFPFGLITHGSDMGALIAYIERELVERCERATKVGVACQTKMLEGTAAHEIVERARHIDAGLVVVGTHGRTGLAHVLLGGVAERIVRGSSRPVLIVPFSKKAA